MANTYYRGDDFNAFGQEWVEINVELPEEWDVARMEFKVGNLPVMAFREPTFPMNISLDSYQTAGLKDVSECYMAIYDREGKKQTLCGSWTFVTKERKV